MPKSDYIKSREADFAAQLLLFKNNIGNYPNYGLTSAQIAAQAADADAFAYAVECQSLCSNCAEQWTAWRDLTRYGGSTSLVMPVPPTFPAVVPAVLPGVESRFRSLVKIVKAHPTHNVSVGEILGIEGPEKTGPDFATFGPVLTLELSGGLVMVRWNWQGFGQFLDMVELCVDRGQGFVTLAFDTTPDYLDTTPLPAAAATWIYKAIYRLGDSRIGQWSAPVSINVRA